MKSLENFIKAKSALMRLFVAYKSLLKYFVAPDIPTYLDPKKHTEKETESFMIRKRLVEAVVERVLVNEKGDITLSLQINPVIINRLLLQFKQEIDKSAGRNRKLGVLREHRNRKSSLGKQNYHEWV